MMAASLNQLSLRARFMFAHWGWVNGLAAVLCGLGVIALGFVLPYLNAQADAQESALQRRRQAALATPTLLPTQQRSAAEQGRDDFYHTLGEQHYAEQQIKTLFYAAAKNGLTLNQADYQAAEDQHGRFHTYRIQIPLRGSYLAIRQFCAQVLLDIPFASLDEIQFQRESADQPQLEAKLRFTLYLNPRKGAIVGTPTTEASGVRQRQDLIGGASAEKLAGSLFRSQSWVPQFTASSSVNTAPPQLLAATAPPLSYTYMGKKMEDGQWEVYLARGNQTFIVREQMTLDYNYRVETIKPPIMTLTYLPLKQEQTLTIGRIE